MYDQLQQHMGSSAKRFFTWGNSIVSCKESTDAIALWHENVDANGTY